jgi:hypothetical protein
MQKVLVMCSMLFMAVMLSAAIPVKVELTIVAQPVATVQPAQVSGFSDCAGIFQFSWPEMPFAGFVPMLGVALEPPLAFGFIAAMEHPPNCKLQFWQATYNSSYEDPLLIKTRAGSQNQDRNTNSNLFAPYIGWLT